MAGRHWRAAPSVGAGIDSGIRAARRRGRPARRRRFLHHVRVFRARPLLQLCPAPRGAGPPRPPAARRRPEPAIPRRSGGTHRRARPGRRGRRSVRPAPARSAGGGDVADQHAARGPRWRQSNRAPAISSRASGRFQHGSAAFSVRQAAARRPPGAHAARPGRRRSGSARCPADNPALRASADDADRFSDGAMAVALQEVREGAAERAIWRQRVAPVRAAPVGCAQPGQRRRIVAPARPDPSARSSGRPSRWRAASHERGGQRVALARAGRLDQFQQFRQGAAG